MAILERTREFGIRMAMGAVASNLVRDVVSRGALIAGSGIALGLLGGMAAARLLQRKRIPALYRNHEGPPAEKLNDLREFLADVKIADYAIEHIAAKPHEAQCHQAPECRVEKIHHDRVECIGHCGPPVFLLTQGLI